jgi:hypothetical protein
MDDSVAGHIIMNFIQELPEQLTNCMGLVVVRNFVDPWIFDA